MKNLAIAKVESIMKFLQIMNNIYVFLRSIKWKK